MVEKQHSTCFVIGVRVLDAEYALVNRLWRIERESSCGQERGVCLNASYLEFSHAPAEQYGST